MLGDRNAVITSIGMDIFRSPTDCRTVLTRVIASWAPLRLTDRR
jgi:hypothetical protein